MKKFATFCLSLLGMALCLIAVAQAQTDAVLGPYPVDRSRPSQENNLIETARLGTEGFGSFKVSANARSAGMGDAFGAVANDVSAMFYNPAGITQVEKREFVGSYTSWLVNSYFGSFAIASNMGWATIGASFLFFKTGDIEETTVNAPQGTGRKVPAGDMAIGLALAKKVTDKLSVAGHVRYIQETLDATKISTVAIDFGTLFWTGFKSSRLTMAMHNLGGDKDVIYKRARMPLTFNLAGAMEAYGKLGGPASLSLAAEQVFYTDYAARYHVGAEFWYHDTVALRGGYKFKYDSEGWTTGVGLKAKAGGRLFKVDMSYAPTASPLDNSHPLRLSVGATF